MPTTSNFGWTTPADTDLVKDGAAAIRTLGNGIDTSLVDLKGGTTGQVLSKASNTDLDYSWTTPNVGDITEVQAGTGISIASGTGPIPVVTSTVATTFDAKGDLVVGTGADTFAKLTAGTNGYILTADSTETTGLKWAAAASGGKVLQVVYADYATGTSIASTSFTDTGGTITITPTLATSKILLICSLNAHLFRYANSGIGGAFRILRGATEVFITEASSAIGWYAQAGTGDSSLVQVGWNAPINYLDSPNTTSAITYKIQGKANTTANSGQVYCQHGGAKSTMLALEIGA